jgi:hypothetical protein
MSFIQHGLFMESLETVFEYEGTTCRVCGGNLQSSEVGKVYYFALTRDALYGAKLYEI